MQAKNVLLALVLSVILYSTQASKHHHKSAGQHSKIHNHEKRSSHHHHHHHNNHHHHKRQTETDHDIENLETRSNEPIKPDHEEPQLVKRERRDDPPAGGDPPQPAGGDSGQPSGGDAGQPSGGDSGQPSGGDSGQPSGGASETSDTPKAPPHPAPPVPIADLHLDVGKVKVESQSDSCNGVLLEPSFVLTSATCVYPNHTAEPYPNITFSMGKESKPVKKVFRNPYWHLTGERKENFALLQLEQPMPHLNQKYLTSMTWSSYALEDLGDSFVADPDPTSCEAALGTARRSAVMRHVSDQLVTLTCSNKGTFAPGSPIFRLVDNAPVIYGVYFGHCTTGSLDRAVSGSCGARISKQVFLDFCKQAKTDKVELTACNSKLLAQTHTNFPTTVFSQEGYDAMTERANNPKAVVIAYHSSASSAYQSFVEDIETVQRLKTVYDKFQFAVIDVNILPVKVMAVPFIEYRTKSSDAFIPYNDLYDTSKFRKFMDTFGKVGAPPEGSTTFLQSLHLHKRSDVPGTSRQGDGGAASQPKILDIKSSSISDAVSGKLVPQGTTCHDGGGYYLVPEATCTCLPTHFGSGSTCQELKVVLNANCQYSVSGQNKNYDAIKTEAAAKPWCNEKKSIEVTVTATGPVSGKTLTPDDCADAIVELVACSFDNNLQILHDDSANDTIKRSEIQRRSPQNTKSGDPPDTYLANFEGNSPPGPIAHAPNTHYFTVAGEGDSASANPYSVLFDGNRGIPVLVGYKISKTNMASIDASKKWLRNRWTKLTKSYVRMGSNKIFLNRGKKIYPEGVVEGQLNPNEIHSYDGKSMDLTFNHINGFPQYSDNGVWKKYQEKIISYAKDTCSGKDDSAVFYSVSGLSDYELTGKTSSAFLKLVTYWPVAYAGAIPQPNLSPVLEDGLEKSIIIPKSSWTVGCCTWTKDGEPHAQTVSLWANNKPRGVPKYQTQPDLHTLGSRLFPGKPCFQFFPANPLCNIAENHFTLAP